MCSTEIIYHLEEGQAYTVLHIGKNEHQQKTYAEMFLMCSGYLPIYHIPVKFERNN